MKQVTKFTKRIALFVLGVFTLTSILLSPLVAAQASGSSGTGSGSGSGATTATGLNAKQQACDGLDATGTTDCGNGTGMDVPALVKAIINLLSVLVGAVSVIMIIIGGFRYVVSNGDSNGVSGAKNTILYAIVGLVIVLFAQVIVAFVIDRATTPPAAAPPTTGTTP
jgi:hypothetical protein